MHDRKKALKIAAICVSALALALIGVFSMYMLWERAPVLEAPEDTVAEEPLASDTGEIEEPMDEGKPLETERHDGVYTILLAGSDNGTGNTDAIMVGKIDTVAHKMDFVSIPRDTVVNVDWYVRKLNSVYWGAKNNDGDGAEAIKMHIRWLLGFNVDCYAVIDLSAFADTIDALGGIDVNVPQDIDYEDPYQGMELHVKKGMKHMGGYESVCYVRYRAGYITGDLGRIETQHGFLRDAAKQLVSLNSIPNAPKVVKILSERTDTDLTAANIAFFIRQALLCESEDINFYTMPTNAAFAQGLSYAFPSLGSWLKTVNTYLNPYQTPVEAGNLNMIFMNGSYVGCTGEMKGAWYFEPPKPTEVPQNTPEATPTPAPEAGASPLPTPETTVPPAPTDTPIPTEEPGVTPTF